MGPVGFAIYDTYQINCHTENWWPVIKPKPPIIFIWHGQEVAQGGVPERGLCDRGSRAVFSDVASKNTSHTRTITSFRTIIL